MTLLGLLERSYYLLHPRGGVVAHLRSRITPGPVRVLDFGGGTGRVSKALAREIPGTYVIADVDLESLAQARGHPSVEPLLIPDHGPLPFPTAAFDDVLVVDVLHHVTDPHGSLRELARMLRPGGRMFIVEFDRRARMTRVLQRVSHWTRDNCSAWSPQELAGHCKGLGLECRITRLDGLRFLLEAERPQFHASVSRRDESPATALCANRGRDEGDGCDAQVSRDGDTD